MTNLEAFKKILNNSIIPDDEITSFLISNGVEIESEFNFEEQIDNFNALKTKFLDTYPEYKETNYLTAFKVSFGDFKTKLFSDEEYVSFLLLKGFNPYEKYVYGKNFAKLELLKADFMEMIVGNPEMYYNYRVGDINKTFNKTELIKIYSGIRKRYKNTFGVG